MGTRDDRSFGITREMYNYLLPVFGLAARGTTRLLYSGDRYYFIGSHADHRDMLDRCRYL